VRVYAKKGQYRVGDIFMGKYQVTSVGAKSFQIHKPVPCPKFPRSRTLDIGSYVSIGIVEI